MRSFLLILLAIASLQGALAVDFVTNYTANYSSRLNTYPNVTTIKINAPTNQLWLIEYYTQWVSNQTNVDCAIQFEWNYTSRAGTINERMEAPFENDSATAYYAEVVNITGEQEFGIRAFGQAAYYCNHTDTTIKATRLDNLVSMNYTRNGVTLTDTDNNWGDDTGDSLNLTITPPTPGDYLIIAVAQVGSDNPSSSVAARLNLTNTTANEAIPYLIGAESSYGYIRIEDFATQEEVSISVVATRYLTTDTYNLKWMFADVDATPSSDIGPRTLIVVRLTDNFNYTFQSNITENNTASTNWVNRSGVFLDKPGNWSVLAGYATRANVTGVDYEIQLNISGQTEQIQHYRPKDVLDYYGKSFTRNQTVNATENITTLVQYRREDTDGAAFMKNTDLVGILVQPDIPPTLNLSILAPTTAMPKDVNGNDILRVNFSLVFNGVNVTTAENIEISNISISGLTCPIVVSDATCTGTENACTTYGSQSSCQNAGCSWGAESNVGTGYKEPTVNSVLLTGWGNAPNGYSDDGSFTDGATGGISSNYSGYATGVPAGSAILGFQVEIEADASSNAGTNEIFIMLGNGSQWCGVVNTTGDIQTSGSVVVLGGIDNLWGCAWDANSANNLWVNVTSGATSTRTVNFDYVIVNVTYQENTCTGTPTTCANLVSNATQCTASGCTAGGNSPQLACYGTTHCQVNCTTPTGFSGLQNLTLNVTSSSISAGAIQPLSVNYAIVMDSCTYPGSGNWTVTCDDNCDITQNTSIGGNDLIFSGTGKIDILSVIISNVGRVYVRDACQVALRNTARVGG